MGGMKHHREIKKVMAIETAKTGIRFRDCN
jgi:hypothetical protein